MTDPLVTLENLTVRFDERPVVDQVNLKIHRGDIITIIGPNGAGKTTLIKAVLGIQKVSEGLVSLKKNLVIGYVPQHLTLEATLPLSVKRFMLLSGRSLTECESALARTGVGHLLHSSVHHLSGGEKQRLLLARALARKPDLLVLDEPAQGVDINGQASLYDLIRQLRDDQHVCCSGYPEDISHDPAFIETFGRPVAESLAVYHHHHNHSHDLHGDVVEGRHTECDHAHH